MALAFSLLPFGMLTALAVSTVAETAENGPPPVERQSLAAFAAAHAGCAAWSDGCIVCTREGSQAFACSTPGIACRPAELTCQNVGEGTH